MIAAVIVLGIFCLTLGLIIIRDELTYQSGYKDGYGQGRADERAADRARAHAGLRSIGIDPDSAPDWPDENVRPIR